MAWEDDLDRAIDALVDEVKKNGEVFSVEQSGETFINVKALGLLARIDATNAISALGFGEVNLSEAYSKHSICLSELSRKAVEAV